jgi:ParB family chromosome partitioning protein
MVDINRLIGNEEILMEPFVKGFEEFVEGTKKYGVMEPILVARKDQSYEILAGKRRLYAAKLAGIKEVPIRLVKTD